MKIIYSIYLLLFSNLLMAEYGLHFDDSGQIIQPDQYYLSQGIKNDEEGFKDVALSHFLKSAEYGNQYAMSLIALYQLQDKDYVKALAWLKMLDLKQIPNSDFLKAIMNNIAKVSTEEQIMEAEKIKAQLNEQYGPYPTLLKREAWKNSLEFTGTRIKGHIPPFLTIQLNSGMIVTGHEVRRQVDHFIYEYEFDFNQGNVSLNDIEIIESKKQTKPK